ncbi:MAG TPA: hypothetical protein VHU83_13040 [Bryobacteraceae bacterium]|jgi:hypothetical protein|nr:hypothetical protein [Bryobacteraceae bacterium]
MPADDRNKPKNAAREVRLDDFVANAVPDPANVGQTLFLTGFLGASSQPEHTRIYADASLSSYVDVETSDIVHSEALSKEQSPLGGSYIWLKRNAEVYFGGPGQSTKGKFLQGPLTAAYGAQFGAAEGAVAGAIKPYPTLQCTWNPPQCPPTAHLFCYYTRNPCVGEAAAAGAGQVGAAGPELIYRPQTLGCTYGPPQCPPTAYLTCNYSNHPWCYAEAAVGGAGQVGAGAAGGANPAIAVTAVCTHWVCNSVACSYFCPHSGICTPIPIRAEAAGQAAQAAPQVGGIFPTLVCSNAPGCWFSFGACLTFGGCGPHQTPFCPKAQPAAAEVAGGYPNTAYFCSMYCNPYGTHHTICACLL